jgi:hypothetical protein
MPKPMDNDGRPLTLDSLKNSSSEYRVPIRLPIPLLTEAKFAKANGQLQLGELDANSLIVVSASNVIIHALLPQRIAIFFSMSKLSV